MIFDYLRFEVRFDYLNKYCVFFLFYVQLFRPDFFLRLASLNARRININSILQPVHPKVLIKMKLTTFLCVALTLIAIKVEDMKSEAFILTEDTIDFVMSPKELSDPKWMRSSGILKAIDIFKRYKSDYDKTVYFTAPNGYVILVAVQLIDLRPNGVDTLTLFVSGNNNIKKVYQNTSPVQKKFYDEDETQEQFFVYNGKLGVTFKTGGGDTSNYEGFRIVYTVQKNSTCDSNDHFTCDNGRCINRGLTCDTHNHCGDRSDQKDCDIPFIPKIVPTNINPIDFISEAKNTAGRIAGIVIGVIISLIIVGGLIAFIIIRRASARSRTQGQVVR